MLRIDLDIPRIAAAQGAYAAAGTMGGVRLAKQCMYFRRGMEHLARRFNERQRTARDRGSPLLADGRQPTLLATVLDPSGPMAWPKRSAAILHGLHLPAPSLHEGGGARHVLDPDSYLARLDDGPAEALAFGDLTAFVIFFMPLNLLRIMWIGAVADYGDAVDGLRDLTAQWTDWSIVQPDYGDWLDNAACVD